MQSNIIRYKTFFIFIYDILGEFTWKIKRKDGSVFKESEELVKFETETSAEESAKEYIDKWSI